MKIIKLMKKTFLFTNLMLLALFLIGCTKSEPTDLRLLELNGDVKTLTTSLTRDVSSTGKKTRQSWSLEGETYYFDENGIITSIRHFDTEVTLSRDKMGNIVSISVPCEDENGNFSDAGYTINYVWDKNGRPIKEEYSNCLGIYHERTYTYNDSVIVGTVEQNCDEGIEWDVTRIYKVLSIDDKGNWTKRLVVESNSENSNVNFSLEERAITYYENDNKAPSSSSSESYSSSSYNSNQYDDSSSKWKEFAGTTYKASQFTSEGYQYYAFSYDRTGKGKYIIWWNYLGTDVVEDKMEFSIYKVESEGNYLYLYTYELNDPVKIQFQGSSLYTNTGDRYEIWR